jgi:RHS repeat-associated protein
MNLRTHLLAWVTVFACLPFPPLIGTAQAQVTDVVSVTHMQGKAPVAPDAISALGPNLFGDSLNLFNGSFRFEQTDISLPGNSALPVALVRTHSPGRSWQVRGSTADWDLDTPRIEGSFPIETGWVPIYDYPYKRCSSGNALVPPTATRGGGRRLDDEPLPAATDFLPWEYGAGINLVIPGAGSQELLKRATGNPLSPSDGGSYPLVTAKNWQIGCLPSIQNGPGEGFVALSPEGIRYRFDWMASRPVAAVLKGGTALERDDMFLMATQVTDRFGNWVRYTYDPAKPLNLTRIEASDGRVISLSYVGGYLSSATDGTRTWTYAYKGDGDLQSVTLPDGSAWSFNLRPFVSPYEAYYDGYVDCDSMPQYAGDLRIATIIHPSGAVGTFGARNVRHGRTNVMRACTYDNASGWSTGSMYAKTTVNFALVSKEINAPGMPSMTWSYTPGDNPEYGEWAPCNGCLDRKTVTVTEPDGSVNRHIFGIKWQVNEGQLLRLEEGWNGSTALRVTEYGYRDPAGQAFPDRFGVSEYFWSDYLSSRNRPQDRRVITQQDVTFTWQVQSGIAGFDAYARPRLVTKSSPFGTRTELIGYSDLTSAWVLGQIAALTDASTGKVMQAHAYVNGLRTATSAFGLHTTAFSYHGDGTLKTLSDGAGQTTSFHSYMRGKPQSAVFADSSSASVVVNNLGNVASFTNEVGSSVSYAFDAMGRVSRINHPTGDAVAYAPTEQHFAQMSESEWGLPAGHWRQVVNTGNGIRVRWFDPMWRIRLERAYDATDPDRTSRFVETRYDAAGRKAFESYPRKSLNRVDEFLPGRFFSYDALNRVTQIRSSSELGDLYETTDYLSGFQRRVINARGHATTTSFQAFDEPTESHPTLIQAPEGVQTRIERDHFGKAHTITRSGGNVSVTRRYVYDGHERLCKTLEPETGATVQEYDAAGNLAWRATGLDLPDASHCNRDAVPAHKKISHGYDARNRLTSTHYGDGSPGVTRSYWADGALRSVNTGSGANWSYSYNNRRLLTVETLSHAGQTHTITRDYNALGHLGRLGYPSGPLSYGTNALGEITQIPGYANHITYHANGAVASYELANGIGHTQTQNIRGLPLANRDAGVMHDEYAYDANGNVSGITDHHEGVFNRSMGYDAQDRLTSAHAPGVWGSAGYAYDAVDNLRIHAVGGRVSSLQYDASNRLASATTNGAVTHYGYDAQGNLTNKGAQTFAFDIGNRLASSSIGGSYVYDGHGRRVRIASSDGSTRMQLYGLAGQLLWASSSGGPRAASNTAYIYLGDKLIAEWNSASGVQFAHTDALGSPVARSSASGALLNRTRFEPYGYVALGTKPGASTSVIGFTGHVQDAETDLVYMQQRYYDPIAGRFLSVDPVVTDTDSGRSFGRYHYAANNPYKFRDPDGRDPEHHHPAGGLTRAESRAAEATGAGMALGLIIPGMDAAALLGDGKYLAALGSIALDVAKPLKVADKIADAAKGVADVGRAGKQARLRELANDDKLGSADRGWIKQELKSIDRGQRSTIRNPPGKDLAHERGREAAKGYDYRHSNLQDRDLHRLQHKYDDFGRANAERPLP